MSHILIVEDDRDIAELVQRYLVRAGHAVDVLGNGSLALPFIASRGPDLVILDLMLPGMDGFEVLRRLKADAATCAIPVVALSAGAAHEAGAGAAAGFDACLDKPIDQRQLLAVLRRVLQPA